MGKGGDKGDKADTEKKVDYNVFGGDLKPAQTSKDDFIWSLTEEPHASRRKLILEKHPEVKKLFGHEPLTKYIVAGLVALQLTAAYLLRDMTWTWQFWVTAYIVGGTATQALFLAIHEITHNLGFKSFNNNKYLAFLANLPIAIPYSTAFKGYHLEHHKYQGLEGVDTDLPTKFEGIFLSNVLGKVFFATFQILFYAVRPMVVKQQEFSKWHALNWAIVFSFDALVISQFGFGPIWYFLISDLLAGSLHPCAAHFIAEHYVFTGETETYSYYGPLNMLTFNVGYHNEHHDFPNIAWSNLPKLKAMCPEFYDNLPYHKSWTLVLWKFISDPNVSTWNRVKRNKKDKSS
jgi:sphingolipid delta-4 desaturase